MQIAGNRTAQKTMVFVHGFGTDQTAWNDVRAAFSEFRHLLLDNVGATSASQAAYSRQRYGRIEAYAEDLLEVCEASGVSGAICVGHSVGGAVAFLAALRRPDLFAKLVLIGASPRYLNDNDYYGGFDRRDLDELYAAIEGQYKQWIAGFAATVTARPSSSKVAREYARTLEQIRPDIALHVARAIFDYDVRNLLSEVDKPTLLIQPKEDVAVPRTVAEYLRDTIPNATLEVIDAVGHLPHLTAPEQVVAAMKRFLNQGEDDSVE